MRSTISQPVAILATDYAAWIRELRGMLAEGRPAAAEYHAANLVNRATCPWELRTEDESRKHYQAACLAKRVLRRAGIIPRWDDRGCMVAR